MTYGKATFSHEQYMVLDELGRGGMGIVYRCKDRKLMKDVAVKVIAWNCSDDAVIRFHKEAKALAKLQHPNILGVQHFGHSDDDSLFLVMDLLSGRSLAELLEQEKHPPFEDALDIFMQICDGLSHAHGKGILHRDIKPSNVFIARYEAGEFKVTITDFGLARLLSEDQSLTKTGISVGSPPYMSPEQAAGKPVDERSDLYSLGCLIFEVLTGTRPFQAENIPALLMQHIQQEPPALSQRAPDRNYPVEMERIVAKCLSKKPEERYQKVRELRQDLKSLRDSIVNVTFQDEGEYEPANSFLRTGAFIISGFQNLVRPSQERKFMRLITAAMLIALGAGAYLLWQFKPKKIELDVGLPGSHYLSMNKENANQQLNRKDAFLDEDDDYFHKSTRLQIPSNEPGRVRENKLWINIDGNARQRLESLVASTARAQRAIDISFKPDWINLQKSDVTDADLNMLVEMKVKGINLSGTKISDRGLAILARSKSLTELYLDGTPISDKGIKHLRNCRIEMLRLSNTQVSDAIFEDLTSIGSLSFLKLDDCKNIKGSKLGLLSKNADLYHLSLRGSGLKIKNLAQLKDVELPSLDLSRLNLKDDDLVYLASLHIPNLATLLINRNPEITDRGLIALANVKNLVTLQIIGCFKITQTAVDEFHRLHEVPPVVVYATHLGGAQNALPGGPETNPDDL